MKKGPLVLILFLSMSGCSAIHDMTEMKDTTKHMDEVTSHMDQTTTGMVDKTDHMDKTTTTMGEKTDHMAKLTENLTAVTESMTQLIPLTKNLEKISQQLNSKSHNMYVDLRQANAKIVRRDALHDMKATTNMRDKVASAAVYLLAFEYQSWKGEDTDDQKKRDDLMGNAVEEFFRSIAPFIKNTSDYSPLSFNNTTNNLLAIAAAMGELNPNQIDLAQSKNFKTMSMSDIIELGLKALPEVQMGRLKGDAMPAYVKQVLRNQKRAVYLLQLRHNFVAACALSTMAGIDIDNILSQEQLVNTVKRATELVMSGTIDIRNQNVEEMKEYIIYLREAIRVRKVLQKLGYPIERSLLIRVMTKIKIVADVNKLAGASPEEKAETLAHVSVINELVGQLNKL